MGNLKLSNRTNVYRLDGATSIGGTYSGHVIGRLNSEWRLERYSYTPETLITKIDFSFKAYLDKSIGTYYNFGAYQGTDLRNRGIKVYISETENMSDWADFYPTNTKNRVGTLTFSNNYTVLSGTLDLSNYPLQANTTYYIFFYTVNTSNSWGAMYWTNTPKASIENPLDNSTYETYTRCSAPTNFEVIGKVLTTGFQVQWSGAVAGNNNPIIGYELKINNGSNVSVGNVSTYKFSYPSQFQGETINISIRTIGSQGAAKYSDWKSISAKVNTLPIISEIKSNYNGDGIYQSGQVTFTLIGKDNDNDSLTYYRKVDGGDIKIDGNIYTTEIMNTTTFKFYAKDYEGEIAGDIATITTKVYTFSPNYEVTASCQQEGKDESVTSIRINKETGDLPCIKISAKDKDNNLTLIYKDVTPNSLTINIRKYIQEGQYTIVLEPLTSDMLEMNGSPIEGYTGILYDIPNLSDCEVFDQYDIDENIYNKTSPELTNFFYKNLRIKVPVFDSSIINYDSFVEFGGARYLTTKIMNQKGYDYFQTTINLNNTGSIKTGELNLIVTGGREYVINLGEFSQIFSFPFNNLLSSWSEIPIVYDRPQIQLTCAGSEDIYRKAAILKNNDGKINVQALVKFGETIKEVSVEAIPGGKNVDSPDLDTLYFTFDFFNEENLKSMDINTTDYFGTKSFKIDLLLTNAYGEKASSSISLSVNFDKLPIISILKLELLNTDNGIAKEINSATTDFKYLEGMKLRFTYSIQMWSYIKDQRLQIRKKSNGNILSNTTIATILENSFEGTTSQSTVSFTLSQIENQENWRPTIQLVSSTLSSNQQEFAHEFSTIPFVNSAIKLLTVDYDGDKTFTIEYNYVSNNNTTSTFFLVINEEEKPVDANNKAQAILSTDSAPVFLRVKESVSNSGYTLTKIWNSNSLVAYNILPTISYRKNRIGINTNQMDNIDENNSAKDAVLYVAHTGDAHKIILKLQDEYGNSRDLTIDLYNGAINNAIIQGGSWDNTPDGAIPTPDLPTNLAAIAYSGDISDLKQTKDITIVFTGGSSEQI